MSEVLSMFFEAYGPSIRCVLDTVKQITAEDGTVRTITIVGGPPQPERHLTLEKLAMLDSQLEVDLRSVLARLEPIVRKLADEDASDPDAVRAEAARVARERQDLERERAAASTEVAQLKAQKERVETELELLRNLATIERMQREMGIAATDPPMEATDAGRAAETAP